MKTLIVISFGCLALFMLDAVLLRFTRLSLAEALTIFACAVASMIVWVTAMNRYIKRIESSKDDSE